MHEFNFCLYSNSFKENGNSLDIIYQNIERLTNLREVLNNYMENLFRKDDIHHIDFIHDKKIWEVLYTNNILERDYKVMLGSIIDKSKDYIGNMDIDTYIGLNVVDTESLIYSEDDWFSFHCSYMENISEEIEFYNHIVKYFPNLEFHEDIKESLKSLDGGLERFVRDIVKSLVILDNSLKECIENTTNKAEALNAFSTKLGLAVTLEGDMTRKGDLSFNFKNDDDENELVYCEPHIKLANSSFSGDTKYYDNRIYFYEGKSEIKNGKILIGHIGKHL